MVNTILLSISATAFPGATAAEPVFTDAQWSATTPVVSPAPPTADLVGTSLVSISVSLAVVVALAIFLGWLVKRLGVKRLVQPKGRHLEVVDSVALGLKRSVSLIRVGDQVVMVGLGEQGVTHLATMPASVLGAAEPAAKALPASAVLSASASPSAPAAPPDPAFQNMLTKVLKG